MDKLKKTNFLICSRQILAKNVLCLVNLNELQSLLDFFYFKPKISFSQLIKQTPPTERKTNRLKIKNSKNFKNAK